MTTEVSSRICAFEDLATGDEVAAVAKGPLGSAHLMRWSAAMENWHRIHYDHAFAVTHDGLPDLVVNGSLKQQFILEMLTRFAGRDGWVWKTSFQFRALDLVGERLKAWGRIRDLRRASDYGLVDLDIGITNSKGGESTPGTATVALPYRNGPAVPYPFVPPADF